MSEFLSMGGYAYYVWSAYGLSVAVLIFNIVWPTMREHAIITSLAAVRKHHEQ